MSLRITDGKNFRHGKMASFRTMLLVTCIAVLFFHSTFSNRAAAQQPNIIYIFVDDLASGMTGFSNPNAIPLTPNLDALATGGMQFTRAYANAICSPSRGTLYTGYHLGHTINDQNVENFRAQDIMPGEMVQPAGYATAG